MHSRNRYTLLRGSLTQQRIAHRMSNKDIRVYVFGVHDPTLLDKPHMWTTLKDCEIETQEHLEFALKLHLSYLPRDHALEVLEGDSDWVPVTASWRPGPQPIIYTRLVPLQQHGSGMPPVGPCRARAMMGPCAGYEQSCRCQCQILPHSPGLGATHACPVHASC